MNDGRQQSILTPWSVIHQATILYRTNFSRFFKLAMSATSWFLVANLVWLGLIGIGIFLISPFAWIAVISQLPKEFTTAYFLLFGGVFLIVTVGFSIFASAKGLSQQALIAVMAYQAMIGQPQAAPINTRQIRSQLWQFWLVEVYLNSLLAAVSRLTSSLHGWWLLLSIMLQIWLAAKWFLANLVIVVEQCNARQALRISRKQSDPYIIPIALILVATGLLTMPLYLLGFSPAIAVWLAEWQDAKATVFTLKPLLHLIQALGLSIIFTTLLHTLTIPLWQSVKAVLYHELRTPRLSQS